mgnify:CR=1 FL=1
MGSEMCIRDRLQSLSGHIGGAWAVAYRPDGGELASAGADGTIRIWDTDTGKELQSLSGHIGGAWAVAYRPDGAELAVAGADGTVRIWDTDTGQELHSCLLYTSPSPRDRTRSRMPSSA